MNAYVDLTTLKARLGITGTGDDTQLLKLCNSASRIVDRFCERFFYAWEGTKTFDGDTRLWLPDDLLSITTFKLDEDADGTYESTLAATDYILYGRRSPNDHPKMEIRYAYGGNYAGFAPGVPNGVQIAGVWGYGDGLSATPYNDSTTTTNEALDSSETGVDVVSATPFAAGQTIRADSEQMYISSIASSTLTVVRGVNGTTAAAHDTSKAVYIYAYPEDVVEACMLIAGRLWKRKDTSFASAIATPDMGGFEVYKGMDPDVKAILVEGGYKRRTL